MEDKEKVIWQSICAILLFLIALSVSLLTIHLIVKDRTGRKEKAEQSITLHADSTLAGQGTGTTETADDEDTTPPEITLKTIEGHVTEYGAMYEEEGYFAYDDRDGNITDKVERTQVGGTIFYTVQDSAGNETQVKRDVYYSDFAAPEIVLEGGQEITMGVDEPFEEPGFSATDNVDGDITDRVEVTGEVDTSVVGTYELHYSVDDSYGNKASVKRIINVEPNPPKEEKQELDEHKVIYLTFDDGPGPYTEQLLDILDKYNVKATFFVTNQFPEYQDMIAEEYKRGHAIGVHTYSHRFERVYKSTKAFWSDFGEMQKVIEVQTGHKTRLMRFPGGSSNSVSAVYKKGIMTKLTQQAEEKGYTYFDWNVLSGDAGETQSPKKIYKNLIAGIKEQETSVVLCHDIHDYTIKAMERFIKKALKMGYRFEPLSESSFNAHHPVLN